MDTQLLLQVLATASAVYLYNVPKATCLELLRSGPSAQHPLSHAQLVVMWAQASLWMAYGFETLDFFPTLLTNAIGTTLCTFYLYTIVVTTHGLARNKILFWCITSLGVVWMTWQTRSPSIIGFMASMLNVASTLPPLLEAKEIVRTKSAALLSLPMAASAFICNALWLTYASFYLNAPQMQVSNGLGALASLMQIVLCVMYPVRRPPLSPKGAGSAGLETVDLENAPTDVTASLLHTE
ncbi:unnamed protein product [Chrysoparadoxa australica]